ncbi:MAG: hypothetical protein ACE5F1_06510 [Planctomycetota bacterium]
MSTTDPVSSLLPPLAGVELREEVELPVTLRGKKISVMLEREPSVGVRLESLAHHEGSETFVFENVPPGDGVEARLWEIRGTHRDSGATWSVGPDAGSSELLACACTGPEQENGILLFWDGIAVPDAVDHDRLWVAGLVTLGEDQQVSRWRIWVGRREGASASLDEIEFPRCHFKGPVTPRPGEAHVAAQLRGRMFFPTAFQGATPFHSANEPLGAWLLSGASRTHQLPGPFQLFQFSCMYAADPKDPRSYRRMLYLGTEDASGFYKQLGHRGMRVQENGVEVGVYEWRAIHFPAFGDCIANPEDPVPTEFGNTYCPPYPAVLGALLAKSDAFWYDACDYYRNWVEQAGMVGPKLEQNTELSAVKGHAPWFGFINQRKDLLSGGLLYETYTELVRSWRRALESPFLGTDPTFVHLQFHNGPLVPLGVDSPERSADEGVRDFVLRAFHEGVSVSFYLPSHLTIRPSPYHRFTPEEAIWHLRDHSAFIHEGVEGKYDFLNLDFGSPAMWPLHADHQIKAEVLGFTGVYLDLLSGTPSDLAYDPPPPAKPGHLAHGGDYWVRGKVEVAKRARARLHESSLARDLADAAVRTFVISEGPLEYVTGHLDLVQESYAFNYQHLTLAEETIYTTFFGTSLQDDVPEASREMTPPLWTAVYHEWAPVGHQVSISSVGLATNGRLYPSGPYPGMSAGEWTDYHVFQLASHFVAGVKFLLVANLDLSRHSPMVRLERGELVVDRSIDPEGTGITVMRAARILHEAQKRDFAGQFVRFGRLERPLAVDHQSESVDLTGNPIHACRKTDPAHAWYAYPQVYEPFDPAAPTAPGWPWGSMDFPVPKVMHSMWRSPEGRLGLVLVNWTRDEASWTGSFDPELYGFAPQEGVRVKELWLPGAPEDLGTHGGTFSIRADYSLVYHGGDVFLGSMPPHSVRVLVFEQESRAVAAT